MIQNKKETVSRILAVAEQGREVWEKKTTPEVKEFFKRQHDAYLADDHSVRIADGLPHFYAAMEHGAQGVLQIVEKEVLGFVEKGIGKLLGKEAQAVSAGGEIEGDGKFQTHDIGWTEALVVFLKNLAEGKYEGLSFTAHSADYRAVSIDNDATIAVLGDWGTGYGNVNNTPAELVANVARGLDPDIVIHLGDVYYYGSEHQVQKNLVSIIPTGTQGTFNLNSNHDMYSVAEPYFRALAAPPFGKQDNKSYFALSNDFWIIVGLDTALLCTCLEGFLYGSLGKLHADSGELIPNPQTQFLTAMAKQAADENKKLIIMSHHNAYDGPGLTNQTQLESLTKKTLWSQVSDLIKPYLDNQKVYWYWGHAHCAYVLKERDNIFARCVGHSAVPWGKGTDFYTAGNSNLEWFEGTPMPDKKPQLVNGLMSLTLNDSTITEKFLTQSGDVTYTAINGKMEKE